MSPRVVLDTNVISAALREDWTESARQWFASSQHHQALTAVTILELVYGIARMPDGRRRESLMDALTSLLGRREARILPLSAAAAVKAGALRAEREAAGRALSLADAQIAGICLVNGAVLATRNTRDFSGLGLDLVDPWDLPARDPSAP